MQARLREQGEALGAYQQFVQARLVSGEELVAALAKKDDVLRLANQVRRHGAARCG